MSGKTALSKMILLTEQQYKSLLEEKNLPHPFMYPVQTPTQNGTSFSPNQSTPASVEPTSIAPTPSTQSPPKSRFQPIQPPPFEMKTRHKQYQPSPFVPQTTPGVPVEKNNTSADVTNGVNASSDAVKKQDENSKEGTIAEVVFMLPDKFKKKGEQLLQHIKNNSIIKWNKDSQIVINGQTFEHSNIIDLVRYAITPLKPSFVPGSIGMFINALKKSNPPYSLLNQTTRSRMNTVQDADSSIEELLRQEISQKQSGSGVDSTFQKVLPGFADFPTSTKKRKITKNTFTWTN